MTAKRGSVDRRGPHRQGPIPPAFKSSAFLLSVFSASPIFTTIFSLIVVIINENLQKLKQIILKKLPVLKNYLIFANENR
jgi:hypothetical protein